MDSSILEDSSMTSHLYMMNQRHTQYTCLDLQYLDSSLLDTITL
jgi:hypothetical protein